jgi:hypothetical protein
VCRRDECDRGERSRGNKNSASILGRHHGTPSPSFVLFPG